MKTTHGPTHQLHRSKPNLAAKHKLCVRPFAICSQSAATENAAAAPHGHVQALAAEKAKAKFLARVLRKGTNA